MKRQTSGFVIALAVVTVLSTVTAVGAITWAIRDNGYSAMRSGPGMMGPASGNTPGWWDDRSWGSMMGMMGWAGATGEAAYLAEMIDHHQEAVTAAGRLARSDRAEMRNFGESIVKDQSAQIKQMQAWLKRWYPDYRGTDDYQPMMRDLSGLSGDRLDRAFLEDMIGHHMGAVMMSQQLLWRGAEHKEVARLARAIRDDQHEEIVEMQEWLGQWFDTDWRGGMRSRSSSGNGSGRGMGPGMMGIQ